MSEKPSMGSHVKGGVSNPLERFHEAQEKTFQAALNEIRDGKKVGHWMWFIFPQLLGLGYSQVSRHYAIRDLEEAGLFLEDEVLAARLISICQALLTLKGKTALEIFGSPDDLKLRSCMTLFSSVKGTHPIFQQVLDQFFDGKKDQKTQALLKGQFS